jgi:colicin import membrane protein
MKFLLLLLSALAAGPAMTQPAAETPAAGLGTEQARIAAERARLEAGFKAEENACYSRFLVNACLNEIRPRRAEAMAELRRQEIVLDDAERKGKGADQIQKIEDKQSAERQQQRADQEQKALEDTSRRIERNEQRAQSQGKTAEEASANVSAAQARQKNSQIKAGEVRTRQEQAAANVQEAKARADKAEQNRADREKRLKEKGPATGKPLPALP